MELFLLANARVLAFTRIPPLTFSVPPTHKKARAFRSGFLSIFILLF